MPRALVMRVIRDLEVAAGAAENADRAPGDMGAEGRAGAQRLARTFRGDANLLRILISFTTDQPDAHPEMGSADDTSDETGDDGSSSRA